MMVFGSFDVVVVFFVGDIMLEGFVVVVLWWLVYFYCMFINEYCFKFGSKWI